LTARRLNDNFQSPATQWGFVLLATG